MANNTPELDISRALFKRVAQLGAANGPFGAAVPIAWANTIFNTPTGRFLRVHNMIDAPDRQDIARGAFYIISGLFQVTLMLQENAGDPFREASIIINHFPADLILVENGVEVRVIQRPDLGPYLQGSPHWEQPVNIHWQAMVKTK